MGSSLLDRYGNAAKVIADDGFEPVEKIYNILEGEAPTAMAKTTGIAIMELATAFFNLKPDVVVTIADRFETIATSIAAAYQNIPLAHIQGGEVTGSIDEKVRHANTKLADIHLVASEDARQRVISGYLVVMQHPVTTEYQASKLHIKETLKAIDALGVPTFWFWPNVDAGSDGTSSGIRQYRELHQPKNVRFFKNMEPHDFLRLIKNSQCLVGNSSVGIRESAFLGIPVVNIGSRQAGRQRAKSVIDCGYNSREIEEAIKRQLEHGHYRSEMIYGDGRAGEKIAQVLAEYPLSFTKTITY